VELEAWLNADLRDGLPLPWAYLRAKLAERWGIPPWEVDAAPKGEIDTALTIMTLEARAARRRGKP